MTPRELLLWVLPNSGYDTVPAMREHLAAFRREHPGLRVSVWVRTQDSLWRRLFGLLKDPQLRPRPDVVQIPSHWTGSLAQLGLLQELSETEPARDPGRWLSPLREHGLLPGTPQVYSLPWFAELRVLYYRREALRRHGLEPETALASWEGFREACRALARRRRGSPPPPAPLANPDPRGSVSMLDVAPRVWAHGGDFFSADGSRSLFQREDACRGISDYFELLVSGWMTLKGPGGALHRGLPEGGGSMEFSGRLPPRGARRAESELGAVPVPGGGAALLSAQSLAVLRGTESPREAEALLRSLAGEESAAAYARSIGAFPATEAGMRSVLEGLGELRPAFERSLERARVLPNLRVLGTLERVFDRSMERLACDVLSRSYSTGALRQELIHAGAEVDHIMSLTPR